MEGFNTQTELILRMKKSQLLGISGGALLAIGTFLPFISYFGHSFTLWNFPIIPQTAAAVMFIILGAVAAFTAFKGGKTMSIVSLSAGAIGAILLLVKTEFTFAVFGIGAWLILVGGVLAISGGSMGMKGN